MRHPGLFKRTIQNLSVQHKVVNLFTQTEKIRNEIALNLVTRSVFSHEIGVLYRALNLQRSGFHNSRYFIGNMARNALFL